MRKIISILFFLFFAFITVKAQQNLVPNWSFEDISSCPNYLKNTNIGDTTIKYAVPWQNGNNGSADILSTCDTFIVPGGWNRPSNGVPLNAQGYQLPHSGNNYAGFYTWIKVPVNNKNIREYPQVRLTDSLKINKKYCVSFYVSPGDSLSSYSVSNIGCFVSKNRVGNDTTHVINMVPQLENPYHNYLNNYIGWAVIQGLYIAGGGENYITIGNFYNDANTDTLLTLHYYDYWATNTGESYYYLDDVSLVEYNEAYAGNDTNICAGVKLNVGNANKAFGAIYNWSVLTGDSSSLLLNDTLSYNIAKPIKTTTYVLQKEQCGIFSYDTLIAHIPTIIKANAGRDTTICIGDSAVIGTNNCNWCTYNWQPVQSQQAIVNVYPLATTIYTLSLKDSCTTTTSLVSVIIDYCQSPVITVPNIFTPNGDDINDSWELQIQNPLSVLNYQCTIYDRWGIKVFETTNYATGFDGHGTSGLACNEGTYYYVIRFTDGKTNENKNLKGFVTLIK